MYPIKLKPALKDYIWGGTRLKSDFHKTSDLERVAESWELSCHKDGPSIIENGELAGLTLDEYVKRYGTNVLGTNCSKFESFPILIKLIDAKDNLSVQVHPDNDYALRVEGEYGKTEMWYIVDCDDGAELLYGFKNSISKEEFKERIQNNTLTEVTNRVRVNKGDAFFIEAGCLHAIGKGIVIAEIQQNSNTTYRIYDYGRLGTDGKPRDLHIEKAIDVTNLCPPKSYPVSQSEAFDGYSKRLLSKCEYFDVSLLDITSSASLVCDKASFNSLLVMSGAGMLCYNDLILDFKKGDSIFIPAGCGKYSVKGNCQIILTKI